LALIWFAVNNAQAVQVQCSPNLQATFPLWSLILVPFFIGVIAGNMLDVVQRFKLRRENRRLRKAVAGKNPS